MKFALVVLVLIPMALAVPDKRFILDTLLNLVDTTTIKKDLQIMLDTIGSDPTEQLCEQECHNIAQQGLLDHACPLLCHSFQELVHHFNIVTMRVLFIALILPALACAIPQKRFLLDSLLKLFDNTTIKDDLCIMINTIGSDPTEQLCEQECHKIALQGLLDHACPLLCHSFQELVHHFNIAPGTCTTTPST
ncbi:uncharacterized protein LOC123531550 [Mercenaria mercenaria]|uniref:uncharacterized protein LOC123531550 n=1 Tax=Mercenaria mercenaria TaxID=6596 RepID=UPI00234E85AF|nr:uncharacterized protein LOC123531550 [Mercenaria mercenaria]